MSSSFKEINKTESLTSKEQQEQHINIEKTKSGTSISDLYTSLKTYKKRLL